VENKKSIKIIMERDMQNLSFHRSTTIKILCPIKLCDTEFGIERRDKTKVR